MPLRITTWNCKGAFERKHADVIALEPDIVVLPEAGRFTGVPQVFGAKPVNSYKWIGDNTRKGLGVISYGNYEISIHESYDSSLRWILPLKVTGPHSFTLFAVWTIPHPVTRYYISCLFEACDIYRSIFEKENVIIAGDFNQSVVFDKPRSNINYSKLLNDFSSFGLSSLYHVSRKCEHGLELEPTFFLHHNLEKPFHIDYIFANPVIYQKGFEVLVGAHAEWIKLSDHMPLTCTFNI